MFPLFFSIRADDKKFKLALAKQGVNPSDCILFHSPISVWVMFTGLYSILLGLFALNFLYFIKLYWIQFLIAYIAYWVIGFYYNAYKSTSFALNENRQQLHIIKYHFPFQFFKTIALNDIKTVEINANFSLLNYLFLNFENNYVAITLNGSNLNTRYYCIGLLVDAYDENFTSTTLDDFHYYLEKNNIKSTMKI